MLNMYSFHLFLSKCKEDKMSSRDKYGNYVNDEGVTIKITNSNGKDHISFYDGPVDEDHSAVHVNIDTDTGNWSSTTHGSDHSDKDPGSGGCFLTSACMKSLDENFDDNCHELQVLRWFRDNYVSSKDVEHYYNIAPQIVNAIDKLPDCKAVYQKIYDDVVKKCVHAIEAHNYNQAYNIYRDSVKQLEVQYLL